MYLDEYEKIEIEEFKGLYKRGMPDQCPADHAICCENVVFSETGQVQKRGGLASSLALNHPVRRTFEGVIDTLGFIILTLDWNGNIYQDNNTTPIFSAPNLSDFVAINLFNKIFILPIVSAGTPPNMQVWLGVNATTRDAAGLAPTSSFSAADGAAGNVDIGDYQIAVSYITDSGFTTQPGPKISTVFTPVLYTAPGSKKIDLMGIPLGGPEVVARQLFITKANSDLFYYLGPSAGGFINDNTTTTATLDFFDTDLVLSADDLFDLLETIPGTQRTGGLNVYHNRLVVVRTDSDVIYISYPEDAESMNNVTGFITDVQDSDAPQGALVLRDTLYITRAFSVYATQDNGDVPGTWSMTLVDGAVGSSQFALGTIAATNTALTTGDVALLANSVGLFLFNGAVVRPELSYKIKDVWDTITPGADISISIQLDPFKRLIYVLLPTNGSTDPNLLMVADYSNEDFAWGSRADLQLRWTYYFFKCLIPASIALASFTDDDGSSDAKYYLRVGAYGLNSLTKLKDSVKNDLGRPINSYYCMALLTPDKGSLNILRAIRVRAKSISSTPSNLILITRPEDMQTSTTLPVLPMSQFPGQDLTRQCNFTNEKVSVQFGTNAIDEGVAVDRVDLYTKKMFKSRPQ